MYNSDKKTEALTNALTKSLKFALLFRSTKASFSRIQRYENAFRLSGQYDFGLNGQRGTIEEPGGKLTSNTHLFSVPITTSWEGYADSRKSSILLRLTIVSQNKGSYCWSSTYSGSTCDWVCDCSCDSGSPSSLSTSIAS